MNDTRDSISVEELQKQLDREIKKRGLTLPNINSLKNIPPYKDMTPAQLEEAYAKKVMGINQSIAWEKRIQIKLLEYSNDYDLDGLKVNDRNNLRHLAVADLQLEDLGQAQAELLSGQVDVSNITLLEKIGNQQSSLRSDIVKLEDMLKISRKVRKSDEEDSVPMFIEELKKKAKRFYEQKMIYVTCPKCHTLLGTIWLLFPQYHNKFTFTCHAKLDDDRTCGYQITLLSKTMMERKMANEPERLPESLL